MTEISDLKNRVEVLEKKDGTKWRLVVWQNIRIGEKNS